MGSDIQNYFKFIFFTVYPVLYVQATFQTPYLVCNVMINLFWWTLSINLRKILLFQQYFPMAYELFVVLVKTACIVFPQSLS